MQALALLEIILPLSDDIMVLIKYLYAEATSLASEPLSFINQVSVFREPSSKAMGLVQLTESLIEPIYWLGALPADFQFVLDEATPLDFREIQPFDPLPELFKELKWIGPKDLLVSLVYRRDLQLERGLRLFSVLLELTEPRVPQLGFQLVAENADRKDAELHLLDYSL